MSQWPNKGPDLGSKRQERDLTAQEEETGIMSVPCLLCSGLVCNGQPARALHSVSGERGQVIVIRQIHKSKESGLHLLERA